MYDRTGMLAYGQHHVVMPPFRLPPKQATDAKIGIQMFVYNRGNQSREKGTSHGRQGQELLQGHGCKGL